MTFEERARKWLQGVFQLQSRLEQAEDQRRRQRRLERIDTVIRLGLRLPAR